MLLTLTGRHRPESDLGLLLHGPPGGVHACVFAVPAPEGEPTDPRP